MHAALALEAQAAKEHGVVLFNQSKAISAIPFLKVASVAGDPEAQFYLGEAIRKKDRFITSEAYQWYKASAEGGNFYAMLRLAASESDICSLIGKCPRGAQDSRHWLDHALAIAEPKAEQGDAEAMYIMHHITGSRDWLEKSAEAGHAIAQYWLGVAYNEGDGFFLFPWERRKAIKAWFKASAEGGYPKGMMEYVSILYEEGDMDGARKWTRKASEAGLEGAITNYAAYLAHEPDMLGYPLDLVKAYGLIYVLADLDGGGWTSTYVKNMLPRIAAKMTPEQIGEGKAFAMQWKATHPPVSFFSNELGW